jgi:hypothetical protein
MGSCSVTMTCVTGHLTHVDFTSEYKNWSYPPPESLFQAPVVTNVHDVWTANPILVVWAEKVLTVVTG